MGNLTGGLRHNMRGMTGLMGRKAVRKKGNVVYLYDTFTDANGTLITSHMPDIGADYLSGGLAIVNNELANNGAGANVTFNVNSGGSKLSFVAGGVINRYLHSLRMLSSGNRFFVQILNAFNVINLYEINNGSWVTVGQAAIQLTTGYVYALIDDGASIKININGVTVINYASIFLSNTTLNSIELGSVGDSIDNLEVRSL